MKRAFRVGWFLRWLACYGAGSVAILAGIVACFMWPMILPVLKVGIADTVGFGTSDGLEAQGACLGPWRPATPADTQGNFHIADLPAERFMAREGWIDTSLHRVSLTIVRDTEGGEAVPDSASAGTGERID